MTRRLTFAYPGDLDLRTGGYGYDRRILGELEALGWSVDRLPLGDGFPFPEPLVLAEAERRLSAARRDAPLMIDGLAYGVLDGWAEREGRGRAAVALVHHPLALETGLSAEAEERLRRSETRALAAARHVVVTSALTRRALVEGYGVAAGRITVAPPGTDRRPLAARNGTPPHILSIGTLTPRKGHDVLLAALAALGDLPWRATILGGDALDPPTAAALRALRDDLGLAGRVAMPGETADSRAAMAEADIFALATRYEGYGMVFAEALSQGLPIVATAAGAVPDVVPAEAGLLVPVDDADAFAGALRLLLKDPEERRRRGDAAARAGRQLPAWRETAQVIAGLLERLA
ncbi:glycosyltransferase family 4 protein [Ensifer soli]|uniref:glycosyltransferase family 4 protein n=1 Tax=Ciceribacter sp. sgz301302 TaxID=3342379 RepID=UPI0035BAB943